MFCVHLVYNHLIINQTEIKTSRPTTEFNPVGSLDKRVIYLAKRAPAELITRFLMG